MTLTRKFRWLETRMAALEALRRDDAAVAEADYQLVRRRFRASLEAQGAAVRRFDEIGRVVRG